MFLTNCPYASVKMMPASPKRSNCNYVQFNLSWVSMSTYFFMVSVPITAKLGHNNVCSGSKSTIRRPH